MTTEVLQLRYERTLRVSAGAAAARLTLPTEPCVLLLPAYDETDQARGEIIVQRLMAASVLAEVSCVGPSGEALHDALDDLIERGHALSVVTTWIVDENEGCDYFLRLAGGGDTPVLLAPVAEREDLAMIQDHRRTARCQIA